MRRRTHLPLVAPREETGREGTVGSGAGGKADRTLGIVSSDGTTQQGGIRSVLRGAPAFRWLWLSQMSSAVGDGILTVGITAYILGNDGISSLGLVLGSNALGSSCSACLPACCRTATRAGAC